MKNYENKMLILILLLLPSTFLFISNTSATTVDDTSLADIIAAGEIVVGIEAGYPPFEQRNTTTDEIEGFDPDIMQYIADDIGVDIVWMDVDWAVIFTGLAAGNYDCIISAVTITAQREETMDFSRWYYRGAQAVMVNNVNPMGIENLEDINSTDVKVGFQQGTSSEWYFYDNDIDAEQIGFATITLAVEALKQGTIDVVLGDYSALKNIKETDSELLYIVDTFYSEDFGIPVQTGFDSLRIRINSILDELLGTDINQPEPNAYYTATYQEWFGGDPYFDYELNPYITTYYTISASSGNNGVIDPDGEIEVRGGDDIEFDFTPDDGYIVDKVLVDGISVEIQRDFTFNNVDSDHTIEVEFAEDPDESAFDIPGYSIVSFMIISFAMVSIITVKIHQRRLN